MTLNSSDFAIIKTEDSIRKRIGELAQEIDRSFRGEEVLVVGVLKGAFIFFSDLIRSMKSEIVCEFLGTTMYREAPLSSGEVKITLDLNMPISGKNVLLVEDIVSDALTFNYLYRNLKAREPKILKTCCFVKKDSPMVKSDFKIDFVGFVFPEEDHIVGYGLDYEGRYRNLPYLAKFKLIK